MIVISDTTPIITLLKIDRLDLLQKLFGKIIIPEAVYRELTSNSQFPDEVERITGAAYIKVVDVHDTKSVELLRRATGLDLGESEAIIYTDDSKADLLLMDEAKGRKIAQQMGLAVMGTIGILMSAYEDKIISKDEIRSYIGIMKESGRHIGENLYGKLLEMIEE